MGEAPGEKYKGKGLKGSLVFVVMPQAHSYCTMRYFVGLTSRDCHDFCQSHSVNGDGCSQVEWYGNDDSKTNVTNLCVHIWERRERSKGKRKTWVQSEFELEGSHPIKERVSPRMGNASSPLESLPQHSLMSTRSQPGASSEGIDNFQLPKALVTRIAKSAVREPILCNHPNSRSCFCQLPPEAKLQKDTINTFVNVTTVFINYLGRLWYLPCNPSVSDNVYDTAATWGLFKSLIVHHPVT